jgi:tetratricopeptide (TPR) repeat protein
MKSRRLDIILFLAIFVVAVLAFGNALNGDFVYDDNWQIVQNYLIQENDRIIEALSSDVWAFRGSGDTARSNYWRPAFVLYLIINQRLFGLAGTTGWHIMNILLHAITAGLAYGLLRFLKLTPWVAGAIALIFALHPVHVETVAWISGAPDLLLAPAFLGALWLLLSAYPEEDKPAARPRRKKRRQADAGKTTTLWRIVAACALAAVAMLSKEIGIVFPLVATVTIFARLDAGRLPLSDRVFIAAKRTWPFYVVAAFYFLLRAFVLEGVSRPQVALTLAEVILTAPSILLFYLRQALFPYIIGPLYPLRAVTAGNMTLANFWLPLLILATACAILYLLARRGAVQQIGLALFLLPLLPAFNIQAFTAEQLVHDRYLYLSLLGLLMMIVPTLAEILQTRLYWSSSRAGVVCLGAAVLVSIPLFLQTVGYNTAWATDVALWEWGLGTDPDSSFGWSQYSNALAKIGQTEAAREAMERSRSLSDPGDITASQLLTDADIAIAERRYKAAEEALLRATQISPSDTLSYERLAVVYREMGDLNRAVLVLATAREQLPHYYCGFTSNLGVLYYLGGDKQQAQNELEQIRELAPQEQNVVCRMGLIHLANLYVELGRNADARAVLEEHLALTASLSDERTQEQRATAQQMLQELP